MSLEQSRADRAGEGSLTGTFETNEGAWADQERMLCLCLRAGLR